MSAKRREGKRAASKCIVFMPANIVSRRYQSSSYMTRMDNETFISKSNKHLEKVCRVGVAYSLIRRYLSIPIKFRNTAKAKEIPAVLTPRVHAQPPYGQVDPLSKYDGIMDAYEWNGKQKANINKIKEQIVSSRVFRHSSVLVAGKIRINQILIRREWGDAADFAARKWRNWHRLSENPISLALS